MRLSDIIRVIESQVIATTAKVAAVSVAAYNEVELESRAKRLYNAETKADRELRMCELRAVVVMHDKMATVRAGKVSVKSTKRK